jgi:hypothetical protein
LHYVAKAIFAGSCAPFIPSAHKNFFGNFQTLNFLSLSYSPFIVIEAMKKMKEGDAYAA